MEIDDEEMEEWEESGLPFWKYGDQTEAWPVARALATPSDVRGHLAARRYMIAGAMAGVAEHCVMFPMDTVKTRMQVAGSAETSLVATARSVRPPNMAAQLLC